MQKKEMLSFILASAATGARVGKERSCCRGHSAQAQRLSQHTPGLCGRTVPASPASQGCGPADEAASRAVRPHPSTLLPFVWVWS